MITIPNIHEYYLNTLAYDLAFEKWLKHQLETDTIIHDDDYLTRPVSPHGDVSCA